jgi:L-rhamnose mutarotase
MKSYGLTINLVDDPPIIEQYKAYHQAVWPEVLANAREKGILKTRIFLLGRRLFMYMETTDDFDLSTSLLPSEDDHPKVKEWGGIMARMQERVPEARPDEWWGEMELVHEA